MERKKIVKKFFLFSFWGGCADNVVSGLSQILMNDWLPRVADLVDAMIDYWRDLVPLKSKDGGRGAILFRCIHALMSLQVRGMIKCSLDHLYQTLNVYKVRMYLVLGGHQKIHFFFLIPSGISMVVSFLSSTSTCIELPAN